VELYLASRADNRSKLASEFVRAFMKRVEQIVVPPQMVLPLDDRGQAYARKLCVLRDGD
jgi:hypothetical protein